MTYKINDTVRMVLTDMDEDTFDPMLLFFGDGTNLDIGAVLPGVRDIEILECPVILGYTVNVIHTDGTITSPTSIFDDLDAVAAYIQNMAQETSTMAHAEPVDANPAQQVADDTIQALCVDVGMAYMVHLADGTYYQLGDIDAVKAWAEQHPEACFGDIYVDIWQFVSSEPNGLMVQKVVAIRWRGGYKRYVALDDKFLQQCLDSFRAMGHKVHPTPPEKRTAPPVDNGKHFVDITEEYFQTGKALDHGDWAKDIIKLAQKAICKADKVRSLKAIGKDDEAAALQREVVKLGNVKLPIAASGFMPRDVKDDISSRALVAAGNKNDPRYCGYIAGEYIKWAEDYLAPATT